MRRSLHLLCLSVLACLFLTGCAGNTLRLLYSPGEPGALPAPSAKSVTVVMFDDRRPSQTLGVRSNGTAFAAGSSVTDWISRSLGDSVLKLGLQVSYAMTMAEARRAKPDYIVTGVIHEFWVQEPGVTSLNASVRLTITMSNEKGAIFSETLASIQERKGVMTTGDAENLLVDTLRGITGPVSRKINDSIQ